MNSICLHVRNEAPYLEEWLGWHLSLGFDHVWIYDNESEDGIDLAVDRWKDRVEIIRWRGKAPFPNSVRDCLARAKALGVRWLALIDADEFIVPTSGDPQELWDDLKLAESAGVARLAMECRVFPSNGQVLMPKGRVTDNYQHCIHENYRDKGFTRKEIVNVDADPEPISTHRFKTRCDRLYVSPGVKINHYRNKSKEDLLIRSGKGFVDTWGYNSKAACDFWSKWEEYERMPLDTTPDPAVTHLANMFNTAPTRTELAVDPVYVAVINHNQPFGPLLKRQLSRAFRKVELWDSGSHVPPETSDKCLPNVYWTGLWNRIAEASNAPVVWNVPADVRLKYPPIYYKEAIVSAMPFGIWGPKIEGPGRVDQRVPDRRKCYSVKLVEGVAWALSSRARQLGFPLPQGAEFGWGHDLLLSHICMKNGEINIIDGRVALVHGKLGPSYNNRLAGKQMVALLEKYCPDEDVFGYNVSGQNIREELSHVADLGILLK